MKRRPPLTHEKTEQILYDLVYQGCDPDLERYLVFAIGRLPKRVAQFALEQCAFYSVGRTARGLTREWGTSHKGHPTRWAIVLDDRIIDEDSQEEVGFTIAHEIAHAYLKVPASASEEEADDLEQKADALARRWGFSSG